MISTKRRPGVIEFKNQREINLDRRKKTEQEYKALRERVQGIVKSNYKIAESK
jgi:hypothetical protein